MRSSVRPALALISLIALVFPGRSEIQKLPHLQAFEDRHSRKKPLRFQVEQRHHFNEASPLSCGNGAKTQVSASEITCVFPKDGEYRPFLAVCDDAKKYCKIFRPKIYVGNLKAPVSAKDPVVTKTQVHLGFKMGKPEAILQANFSKRKAKSVLLYFFALWCPPCNDLDEFVFPTEAFQQVSSDLEKIKVNVDEEESWNLKENYKILGYPTLVYLNPRGEEIGRSWGSQSPEVVVAWIQRMKRFEAMPLSWAARQSDEGSVKRMVEWNFDLSNFDQVKTLTGARSEAWAQKYFLRAELALASDKGDSAKQIEVLREALIKFPSDVLAGYWLLDLVSLDKKLAKERLQPVVSVIDSWIQKPQEALQEGYSVQDLMTLKVDLYEALEKKDELRKAQEAAIAFFERELAGGKKVSRGRSHLLAYYYRETGRLAEAKVIYESLIQENATEFTFYYRYAKVLHDLKIFDESLRWLEKGAPFMSEGNQRLQYSWLKGKILGALGRKAEALQLVEGTLQIAKAPAWEKDLANRWLRDLRELKRELSAEK